VLKPEDMMHVEAAAKPWKQPLRELFTDAQNYEYFESGFKLASLHGPVYLLNFTARDQFGGSRDYTEAVADDGGPADRIVFVSEAQLCLFPVSC
jgi:hypothetical protein